MVAKPLADHATGHVLSIVDAVLFQPAVISPIVGSARLRPAHPPVQRPQRQRHAYRAHDYYPG